MATFEVWGRYEQAVTGTIELAKADVLSIVPCSVRTGPLQSSEHFRSACFVTLAEDDSQILIPLPQGELEDRLNDDTATAPSPSIFENM